MQEQGTVIELKGQSALVRMMQSGGCEGCSMDGACSSGSEGRVLEATNKAGASTGQQVVVEFSGRAFLKASFVVYIVPVLFLFLGAYLGGEFGPEIYSGMAVDSWQAVAGVAFLALSIVVLRVYDSMVKKSSSLNPVITRIVSAGTEAK